jgi:hypothetical protein
MLCAWTNAGNTRQKNAAKYLTLEIMLHLPVRKVEHPTLLSHLRTVLAGKKRNCCTCIKRYGEKTAGSSGMLEIIDAFRVARQFPIIGTSRASGRRSLALQNWMEPLRNLGL